jgi:hypothetical protein
MICDCDSLVRLFSTNKDIRRRKKEEKIGPDQYLTLQAFDALSLGDPSIQTVN